MKYSLLPYLIPAGLCSFRHKTSYKYLEINFFAYDIKVFIAYKVFKSSLTLQLNQGYIIKTKEAKIKNNEKKYSATPGLLISWKGLFYVTSMWMLLIYEKDLPLAGGQPVDNSVDTVDYFLWYNLQTKLYAYSFLNMIH